MLPKRLMNFRILLAFGLASILVLLCCAGCRVSSTPTGEPTETPCEACQAPESPLVAALNSPLMPPAVRPTQSNPLPAPTRTARPNASPTLVVKTPTAVPLNEAAFNLTVVHSNDTWGYLDPCG
jgi:hypothetical protein